MPVPEVTLPQPARPEAETAGPPSRPAVKITRAALRPLGRKLNYVGILGGIVGLASLIMPWWTQSAVVPVVGLGNMTAIEFPLYLYESSAGLLANPPSQVIALDLWFSWLTLALVALAALLAIVGSTVPGRGRIMLVVGGLAALISLVVFGIGLQNELTRTGSGLDLFKTTSGAWGTLTTYPSFGFWATLMAAATMLVAATRHRGMTAAPAVTVEQRASEIAPTDPHGGETDLGLETAYHLNQ